MIEVMCHYCKAGSQRPAVASVNVVREVPASEYLPNGLTVSMRVLACAEHVSRPGFQRIAKKAQGVA